MRNSVSKAILVAKKDVNEKDMLLEFLTDDLGYIVAKDYSSQSGGSKSFMLYSTGDVYLYKPETANVYTIRDSKVHRLRIDLLKHDSLLKMSALADCIKHFSKFADEDFFNNVDRILDAINDGCEFEKVFVYAIEYFLRAMRGNFFYTHCPVCSREYRDDELLGYSNELYMPVCNECADIKNTLLPGVRRYLMYTSTMKIEECCNVDIKKESLSRAVRYQKFQLSCINPKGFKTLSFI